MTGSARGSGGGPARTRTDAGAPPAGEDGHGRDAGAGRGGASVRRRHPVRRGGRLPRFPRRAWRGHPGAGGGRGAPVLLTIPEAAARYGLAESNLYRWLASQGLPGAARLGGRWYLRTAAFERWLAGEAVETPTVVDVADTDVELALGASGGGGRAHPPPSRSSRPRGRLPPV